MSIPLLSRGSCSCRQPGTETYSSLGSASIPSRQRVGINALVGCSSLLFDCVRSLSGVTPLAAIVGARRTSEIP